MRSWNVSFSIKVAVLARKVNYEKKQFPINAKLFL